jgi:prepilin-type N-terminal cleavage/methylation domain-containing protein
MRCEEGSGTEATEEGSQGPKNMRAKTNQIAKRAGRPHLRRNAGFSLIEVLLGMTVFSISALTVMNSMLYSSRLDTVNKETAAATRAARRALERLRGTTFSDIYASFNAATVDDPGGDGTAPGSTFTAPGLEEVVGGPGSITGEIVFPVGASTNFDETLVAPELGLPRDLNADGKLSKNVPPEDVFVLPVTVRITWTGSAGERSVVLHTVLRP